MAAKQYETLVIPQTQAKEKRMGEIANIWNRQLKDKLDRKDEEKVEAKRKLQKSYAEAICLQLAGNEQRKLAEAKKKQEVELAELKYLNEKDRRQIEKEEAAKAARWRSALDIKDSVTKKNAETASAHPKSSATYKMTREEYLINKDRLMEFAEVYKSGDLMAKLGEFSNSKKFFY